MTQINTQPQMPPIANRKQPLPAGNAALGLIDTCKFQIRTLEEAALLSRFSAGIFRDAERVEPGLFELLLNAVEHGCLGIGFDLKTKLLESRNWQGEIARRQSLPENRKKNVDVVFARRPEGIFVVITDPGPGFDWKSWTSLEPARAAASHGRGIARARGVSFDSLAYNPAGNQVAVHVKSSGGIIW